MPTRNTGTPTKDIQGNNVTKSHLSTNILLKVDGLVIGAVQSINIKEDRQITMVQEIGTDGNIDSAPSRATAFSGSVSRIRYNNKRLLEAFGRGYTHIHAQRIPFDIEIQDIFASADEANAHITIIENIWFNSLDFSYNSDNYIITENANWQAENIYSMINGSDVVKSVGNGDGAPIILNRFEQESNRGAYLGALDAPGLLNAFIDDPRN